MSHLTTSRAGSHHLVLLEENELNFEEIFAITDLRVAKQAIEMARFFQQAIVPREDDAIRFDVQKAVELVKEDPDKALIEVVDQELRQENDSVEAMVEQVLGLLNSVLDIALGAKQQEQLRASIVNVFTNLAPQEGDAWIFWSKEEGHKSSYTYNITFAVQNVETGIFLYALPMSMTITADLSKEQVLFIKLKDKSTYSVRVQSLKVVEIIKEEAQRRALEELLRAA